LNGFEPFRNKKVDVHLIAIVRQVPPSKLLVRATLEALLARSPISIELPQRAPVQVAGSIPPGGCAEWHRQPKKVDADEIIVRPIGQSF
jgi:hypothetical protein